LKVFLDTSALAKRYVQEPGSDVLERFFISAVSKVIVSTLAFPEFGAAIGRKLRERQLPRSAATHAMKEFEKDWIGLYVKVPLTEAVAEAAAALAIRYPLKGADAVHLATAIGEDVEIFITSDAQLMGVAQKEGLKGYDPSLADPNTE
jgi:hypothetical protein